ncbi:hypothetical protein V2J09_013216 [Rumex salicifolius]
MVEVSEELQPNFNLCTQIFVARFVQLQTAEIDIVFDEFEGSNAKGEGIENQIQCHGMDEGISYSDEEESEASQGDAIAQASSDQNLFDDEEQIAQIQKLRLKMMLTSVKFSKLQVLRMQFLKMQYWIHV